MELRPSVRAIVVSPEREVLLIQARRSKPEDKAFWFTPGGGLEAGESDEQGLRRELREELGLETFTLGPLLGHHRFVSESRERRTEHRQNIYLVQCARFEPFMSDQVELASIQGFRWWPLAELLETAEPVYPLGLAVRVQRYLERGETQTELWFE